METTSYVSFPVPTPLFDESVIADKPKRVFRRYRWLLALLTAAGIGVTSVLGIYAYAAWALGNPVIAPLKSNPAEAIGVAYEDVLFPSADGSSEVSGWYLPAGTGGKTVVLSHGYGTNREEPWVPMYELARQLHKQNFNVVMFDYGFTKPNRSVTGGIVETQELLGAVQYAKSRESGPLYVWGFSMGAGTALQAALKTDLIDGMILDSTFILDPDTMFHNIKQHLSLLPRTPSVSLINLFFPVFSGYSLNQVPYQAVKTTTYDIPLFLIHGEQDTKAPYTSITSFYSNQKANPASQLWLVPDGHHELIFAEHRKEYLKRTLQFLDACVRQAEETGHRTAV
ncbi:hypothetical protein J31TS4_36760 [Paenibacillus sp. J31TS4]|uniref:alpha/beta hydrolase n=1 Tax=Paenibacillus sp. J31TS4 TaxID=2807195 RepID=UPI001B0CF27B|nr:alpha/beta fold hydrolase [Paenibacillus sp. J31TS4]GIP40396.1 hypothetical protein J31TS4_36760 [Paenibacillus sp. J31TS4]